MNLYNLLNYNTTDGFRDPLECNIVLFRNRYRYASGQDFVNNHFPMLTREESVEFTVQNKKVSVSTKIEFTI